MNTLKCPHCNTVFNVDEKEYAILLGQVRNQELQNEVERRMRDFEKSHKAQMELAMAQINQRHEAAIALKEKQMAEERATQASALEKLKAQLTQSDMRQQLALGEADKRFQQQMQEKETRITQLTLEKAASERKALEDLNALRDSTNAQLKAKDEQIEYYKDFKSRLSTKMIGESLEVHCSTEFNRIRPTAYPHAYFDKDNDASGGSKGDFIFRDYSDGQEYISIMFEMKNQSESAGVKHKNEDFFRKLDEDRRKKGCEYAVLVSLLEPDNDYYNDGIVDVSYRYEKMFVVRPQFFLPIIALLTSASRKSVELQKQLIAAQQQSIDVTNFENKLMDYQDKFGKNVEQAAKKFQSAIDEIDTTIKHLTKVKEGLIGSIKNLDLANDKLQDITIRKLTWRNPTIKEMFDEERRKNPPILTAGSPNAPEEE